MIINGVDIGAVAEETTVLFPTTVPGRVVQIDADFLAYQVSAVGESLDEMYHNADVAIEKLRLLAGAETVALHLTPQHSNKGHRDEQAILLEYQANRDGKEKPKYLHIIRSWMETERDGIQHATCEADDGMCIAQTAAIARGEGNLSVIASMDKDLKMVAGLHIDWHTGEFFGSLTDTFGYISICTKTSSKKCIGYGTKFFWAQMLMGDAADNIKGIPKVTGMAMNKYKPNKKITAALKVARSTAKDDPKRVKALETIYARKSGPCGAMLAHTIIDPLNSDLEGFKVVRGLYEDAAKDMPEAFIHWNTELPITGLQALLSNGKLLWMRRYANEPNDVIVWLKGLKQ